VEEGEHTADGRTRLEDRLGGPLDERLTYVITERFGDAAADEPSSPLPHITWLAGALADAIGTAASSGGGSTRSPPYRLTSTGRR